MTNAEKLNKRNKTIVAVIISVSVAVLAVAVCAGAFFALVPKKAARYTLFHSELEYVADVVSSGDAGSKSELKELKADNPVQALRDVLLVYGYALKSGGRNGIVCVEAGESITKELFFPNGGQGYIFGDISSVPTNDIGYYLVKTQINGKNINRLLIVCDSIGPRQALGEFNKKLWVGDDPSAEEFAANSYYDATWLSYEYELKPDCSAAHKTNYTYTVTDRGGNMIKSSGSEYVYLDTEPPVISGAQDRTVTIGESVLYKEGVTVTDNRDGDDIELKVDISEVDPANPGTYPVTYSAKDTTGLTAAVTVYFTFEYSEEDRLLMQLDEKIQPILRAIIKEGMTERQKARAIYNWVHNKISYTGTSDKSSWIKAAIKGMKSRSGDCFTYFAISKAMLTAVGIENLDVQRLPSSYHPNTTHWWNMVYVDGCWWHFDTTRRADGTTFFLVTTEQLLAYSNAHNHSHDFDVDSFPKTGEQ